MGPPRPTESSEAVSQDRCPRVAVVVPVHNKLPLTLRFLESFRQVDYPNYTMVLVDDGSRDGTGEALARDYPQVVRLEGDGNLWWSGGTNKGVRYALQAGYDYVLTINNDTLVAPDFLSNMVATALDHPRCIVGARINFLDRPQTIWSIGAYSNWSTGVILQCGYHGGSEEEVIPLLKSPHPVEMLTGCGTLVPAECYRELGLYDERWCPQYHGDTEFAMRAGRQGYQVLVELDALVWNDTQNTSTNKNLLSRRSGWFWRPLVAIHTRYCPKRYVLRSLVLFYLMGYVPGTYRFLQGAMGWKRAFLQRARSLKRVLTQPRRAA